MDIPLICAGTGALHWHRSLGVALVEGKGRGAGAAWSWGTKLPPALIQLDDGRVTNQATDGAATRVHLTDRSPVTAGLRFRFTRPV